MLTPQKMPLVFSDAPAGEEGPEYAVFNDKIVTVRDRW